MVAPFISTLCDFSHVASSLFIFLQIQLKHLFQGWLTRTQSTFISLLWLIHILHFMPPYSSNLTKMKNHCLGKRATPCPPFLNPHISYHILHNIFVTHHRTAVPSIPWLLKFCLALSYSLYVGVWEDFSEFFLFSALVFVDQR